MPAVDMNTGGDTRDLQLLEVENRLTEHINANRKRRDRYGLLQQCIFTLPLLIMNATSTILVHISTASDSGEKTRKILQVIVGVINFCSATMIGFQSVLVWREKMEFSRMSAQNFRILRLKVQTYRRLMDCQKFPPESLDRFNKFMDEVLTQEANEKKQRTVRALIGPHRRKVRNLESQDTQQRDSYSPIGSILTVDADNEIAKYAFREVNIDSKKLLRKMLQEYQDIEKKHERNAHVHYMMNLVIFTLPLALLSAVNGGYATFMAVFDECQQDACTVASTVQISLCCLSNIWSALKTSQGWDSQRAKSATAEAVYEELMDEVEARLRRVERGETAFDRSISQFVWEHWEVQAQVTDARVNRNTFCHALNPPDSP